MNEPITSQHRHAAFHGSTVAPYDRFTLRRFRDRGASSDRSRWRRGQRAAKQGFACATRARLRVAQYLAGVQRRCTLGHAVARARLRLAVATGCACATFVHFDRGEPRTGASEKRTRAATAMDLARTPPERSKAASASPPPTRTGWGCPMMTETLGSRRANPPDVDPARTWVLSRCAAPADTLYSLHSGASRSLPEDSRPSKCARSMLTSGSSASVRSSGPTDTPSAASA